MNTAEKRRNFGFEHETRHAAPLLSMISQTIGTVHQSEVALEAQIATYHKGEDQYDVGLG